MRCLKINSPKAGGNRQRPAIAGPLKAHYFQKFPRSRLRLLPGFVTFRATINAPDTTFSSHYADLDGFDNGTIESGLEKRDSLSWQNKSWVIGVIDKDKPKAYDWNELVEKRMIQDAVNNVPLLITLESDTASFHVFNRMMDNQELKFEAIRRSEYTR